MSVFFRKVTFKTTKLGSRNVDNLCCIEVIFIHYPTDNNTRFFYLLTIEQLLQQRNHARGKNRKCNNNCQLNLYNYIS